MPACSHALLFHEVWQQHVPKQHHDGELFQKESSKTELLGSLKTELLGSLKTELLDDDFFEAPKQGCQLQNGASKN